MSLSSQELKAEDVEAAYLKAFRDHVLDALFPGNRANLKTIENTMMDEST